MYTKITEYIEKNGLEDSAIRFSDNTNVLKESVDIGGLRVPNRIVFQPMEGCDGTADGSLDELTMRRYRRFAESGAGLIWFEAVAVAEEARANPRQLFLTEKNVPQFQSLVAEIKNICLKKHGYEPLVIMQATHSGRYSKPHGTPQPIIAYRNSLFEGDQPLSEACIITDAQCDELPEKYEKSAKLAKECGFDGIDVKCCHRYLFSEFLSAYTRSGKYGGSFENRTSLYFNCIEAAKRQESERFLVTSRLNVYDGFPYPYGFGVAENGGVVPDLTESEKLIEILVSRYGFTLLNVTIGNPYVNPHVNRPFVAGPYKNPENPLRGVERIADITAKLQHKFPKLNIILSGTSNLRENSPYYAAGMVENKNCTLVGFGRMIFAYPDFVQDLFQLGEIKREKCCVTCSRCSGLMRSGKVAGCPVFDRELYGAIEKQ